MIVAGRISTKMLPVMHRIYNQMCEPKWVISMGACAAPVVCSTPTRWFRVWINSSPLMCTSRLPPRPEMLIEGVMAIQRIIDEDNLPTDGNGKRIPLNLALEPNYEPAAQPVDVSVGLS